MRPEAFARVAAVGVNARGLRVARVQIFAALVHVCEKRKARVNLGGTKSSQCSKSLHVSASAQTEPQKLLARAVKYCGTV